MRIPTHSVPGEKANLSQATAAPPIPSSGTRKPHGTRRKKAPRRPPPPADAVARKSVQRHIKARFWPALPAWAPLKNRCTGQYLPKAPAKKTAVRARRHGAIAPESIYPQKQAKAFRQGGANGKASGAAPESPFPKKTSARTPQALQKAPARALQSVWRKNESEAGKRSPTASKKRGKARARHSIDPVMQQPFFLPISFIPFPRRPAASFSMLSITRNNALMPRILKNHSQKSAPTLKRKRKKRKRLDK